MVRDPWWRHQMEKFSTLLALCAGNSPVTGEFPTQRPVTRSFDASFDLRLNKRLSKQSWGCWFETPSRSLWRHGNDRRHKLETCSTVTPPTANDIAINNFRNDLSETDIAPIISSDRTTDPNSEYANFERIITPSYEKHFPEKRVKFNKHKHKWSYWITSGIVKSIEFRDKLYRRLNKLSTDSPDYELVKYNLKVYNRNLNQCIRKEKLLCPWIHQI